MGGRRWRAPVAANCRGHVPPRIVEHLAAAGWRVHRIGQAAYVHSPDDGLHLILGVWARRDPRPTWADRLGRVSEGYWRRFARKAAEQEWSRLARDARGRFLGLMQWWRWPAIRVYRWDRR
jgi:hypothetical protein